MLLAFGMVKNEADVIETMIRHNLQYVDHIHFIDNGSTDTTNDILRALGFETKRVTFTVDNSLGHRQMDITNRALPELAERYAPTAIVPLDADEFIKGDPGSFRVQCESAKAPLHYWWQTYVPRPEDDQTELNPLLRIRHRRVTEAPGFMKIIIPGHLIGKTILGAGSHDLFKDKEPLETTELEGISLAHFPIRTRGQSFAKAIIGAWNLKLRGITRNEMPQWHDIAGRILENGRYDDAMFYEAANTYAASAKSALLEDPVISPTPFELTLTPTEDDGGLTKILHYTEEVVQRHAPKRRNLIPKPLRPYLTSAVERRNAKSMKTIAHRLKQGVESVPVDPPSTVVQTTINGRRVNFCVSFPNDILQQFHLSGEFYEDEELEAIAAHVPKGGTYLDIGSNVGNHAIYVGLFCNPSRIILFEPNTAILSNLRLNIMLNGLSEIADTSFLGIGLGRESGGNFGVSWRHPKWDGQNTGGAQLSKGAGNIPVRRGDDLLKGQKVDFIKIDVEGMEIDALAGLEGVIRENRPKMFIEVDNTNESEFLAWLDAKNYAILDTFSRYPENRNYLCAPQ